MAAIRIGPVTVLENEVPIAWRCPHIRATGECPDGSCYIPAHEGNNPPIDPEATPDQLGCPNPHCQGHNTPFDARCITSSRLQLRYAVDASRVIMKLVQKAPNSSFRIFQIIMGTGKIDRTPMTLTAWPLLQNDQTGYRERVFSPADVARLSATLGAPAPAEEDNIPLPLPPQSRHRPPVSASVQGSTINVRIDDRDESAPGHGQFPPPGFGDGGFQTEMPFRPAPFPDEGSSAAGPSFGGGPSTGGGRVNYPQFNPEGEDACLSNERPEYATYAPSTDFGVAPLGYGSTVAAQNAGVAAQIRDALNTGRVDEPPAFAEQPPAWQPHAEEGEDEELARVLRESQQAPQTSHHESAAGGGDVAWMRNGVFTPLTPEEVAALPGGAQFEYMMAASVHDAEKEADTDENRERIERETQEALAATEVPKDPDEGNPDDPPPFYDDVIEPGAGHTVIEIGTGPREGEGEIDDMARPATTFSPPPRTGEESPVRHPEPMTGYATPVPAHVPPPVWEPTPPPPEHIPSYPTPQPERQVPIHSPTPQGFPGTQLPGQRPSTPFTLPSQPNLPDPTLPAHHAGSALTDEAFYNLDWITLQDVEPTPRPPGAMSDEEFAALDFSAFGADVPKTAQVPGAMSDEEFAALDFSAFGADVEKTAQIPGAVSDEEFAALDFSSFGADVEKTAQLPGAMSDDEFAALDFSSFGADVEKTQQLAGAMSDEEFAAFDFSAFGADVEKSRPGEGELTDEQIAGMDFSRFVDVDPRKFYDEMYGKDKVYVPKAFQREAPMGNSGVVDGSGGAKGKERSAEVPMPAPAPAAMSRQDVKGPPPTHPNRAGPPPGYMSGGAGSAGGDVSKEEQRRKDEEGMARKLAAEENWSAANK
ncbi:hypothetical protein K402DRAFT_418909 [Aulographum hederae CBS 113979]|uniref:Uncharacterized protein n=1 Tax=Aulographum hederae CBS 113979 TaxID=1176131 RepID=A0A6G1H7E8_9PEZI|nr:hypothetical protein K402DRAFT_418909 [Aulographum hederae CBS 113979]